MKSLLPIFLMTICLSWAQENMLQSSDHYVPLQLSKILFSIEEVQGSFFVNHSSIDILNDRDSDSSGFSTQPLERGIQIEDLTSKKKIFFKEGKRIRIKIKEGKKISGRFLILDEEHIQIRDKIIPVKDITKIKKNPAYMYFLNIIILHIPFFIAAIPFVLAAYSWENVAAVIFIPVGGYLYSIFTVNFLKGHYPSAINELKIII